MKICQLLHSGLGGQATVAFSLAKEFKEIGHENYFIFYGNEPVSKANEENARQLATNWTLVHKKAKLDVLSFGSIYSFLKSNHIDSIINHSPNINIFCCRYCINYKVPLISVEHTDLKKKTVKDRFWTKMSWYLADKVVVLNEQVASLIPGNSKHKRNKLRIIKNGIDTSLYKPTNDKTGHKDVLVLGMMARFVNGKRFDVLVKTMARIHKNREFAFRLELAGDGVTLQETKELAAENNLDEVVVYHGELKGQQVPDFLNSLDLYVHASDFETQSTSILQAMSCELPVIVSDIEGNRMVIEDGKSGWLSSHENLYPTILSVIKRKEEMIAAGQNARKRVVANYTSKIMSGAYLSLLEEKMSKIKNL